MNFRSFKLLICLILPGILLSEGSAQPPKREFRAAWVATAYNLDWPSSSNLSSETQQMEFIEMANRLKKSGMNAMVVQVRPAGDAFYPSDFAPWSQWLSGKQGLAPSPYYDPMNFMIKECHKRNMEFHAWFNPFRAISHTRFSSVSDDNVAHKHPDWFFDYGNTRYFDPGNPNARAYLISVIAEVVEKYHPDGIHLDDYFYPYPEPGAYIPDDASWKKYGHGYATKADWRRNNVSSFIKELYDKIKEIDRRVKFGVSPSGVWRNCNSPDGCPTVGMNTAYDDQYADTKKWLQEGWVDYLAPQLYWNSKHKYANYNDLLKWWAGLDVERHLYIGHSIYMMDLPSMRWLRSQEYTQQVRSARTCQNVCGSIFFRAETFTTNPKGIADSLSEQVYPVMSLIPEMPWLDSIPPNRPYNLSVLYGAEGVKVTWAQPRPSSDGETASYYAVYRFLQGEKFDLSNPGKIISIQRRRAFLDNTTSKNNTYWYAVTSFDRLNNESLKCVRSRVFVP